jgi:hypothetical protein
MGLNFKDSKKATLDYLIKDIEATGSDFKKIGRHLKNHARDYLLSGLAFLTLATSYGCPWQKKHDRDTVTGSSTPPAVTVTLSGAGDAAANKRIDDFDAYFPTAKGTKTDALIGEADHFFQTIASAGTSNTDVNDFINMIYDREVDSDYNILCGGTTTTSEQFAAYFKYLAGTWSDGKAEALTADDAPFPVNGKVVNYELDNKMSGNWAFAANFADGSFRAYLKNEAGNEIAFPTYTGLTVGQRSRLREILKANLKGASLDNEIIGGTNSIDITYDSGTGEPIYDNGVISQTSQTRFDQ